MTSSQSGGARAASNIAPPPSQLEQTPPLTLGHHTLEVLTRTLGSSSEPCVDVAHSGESASELRADMLSSSSTSSAAFWPLLRLIACCCARVTLVRS